MPYRKPYTRRYRRRYTKKPSRWTTYKNAGSQLWKDVKYLKSLLNVEYKNIDNSISMTPDVSASTSMLLNSVAQGDDRTNRDGRSVRFRYMTMKLQLHISTTSTITRLIIVNDREAENGVALDTKLLTSNSITSLYNIDSTRRFKVLFDRTFSMDEDNKSDIFIKFNKRMFSKTKYNGTSTGISNIETNAYYLYAVSNAAFGVAPVISGVVRLRFVDN